MFTWLCTFVELQLRAEVGQLHPLGVAAGDVAEFAFKARNWGSARPLLILLSPVRERGT